MSSLTLLSGAQALYRLYFNSFSYVTIHPRIQGGRVWDSGRGGGVATFPCICHLSLSDDDSPY